MKLRTGLMLALSLALFHDAFAAEGALRAAAARVDITPPIRELPAPYKVIHDPLYVRALLIDNGAARAAVIVADIPAIQAGIHADLIRQIAGQAGIPAENILFSTSHTHNSIRVDKSNSGGIIAGSDAFTRRVIAATLEAMRQAAANLQPVRAGYAVGKSHLIANRNEWSSEQRRYIDGIDRSGTQFVDPSLGVFKFETLSGELVALMLNYGIEPVVNEGVVGEISGDVPGAAARYVEEAAGGKAVALFTIAPAASPAYRVWAKPVIDPREVVRAHGIMAAMGTLLGEEALAAARGVGRMATQMHIAGGLETLECPGKVTTPQNLARECSNAPGATVPACNFKDADGPAVSLHYGLLRLGDVAIVHADANVVPSIGDKLKRALPLSNTMVVLDNFGPFRFLVDDASYPLNTYEATATRAKQGCGEQGFIGGVAQLLDQLPPPSARPAQQLQVQAPPTGFAGALLRYTDVSVTLADREGQQVTIAMTPGWTVSKARSLPATAVKPGDFVASANKVVDAHTGQSTELRIMEPGYRPEFGTHLMAQTGAAMTHGTVSSARQTAAGVELDVDYPGGSRHLIVPSDMQVLDYEPFKRDVLKPGTRVSAVVRKDEQGVLRAGRLTLTVQATD
jgi:neutral ceramidase